MRISRAGLVGLAVAGLATLAAGCGGGGGSNSSSPGVASMGSTTTAGAASAANGAKSSSNYAKAVAYSQCMQSHGVPNFPDPNSKGMIVEKTGALRASGKSRSQSGGQSSNGFNPNSSAFKKAEKTCQHLAPGPGNMSPAQQQKIEAEALKYSECMRAHGVPDFPDPTVTAHSIGFRINGKPGGSMNPNSPQFQKAQKACRKDLPGL